MGKKKKKWYETGEFEDGYQFGDIFRTIKNALSTNDESPKTSNDKTKTPQDKKETKGKEPNNTNLVLGKVENGKISFDPVAQAYGFSSEVERQNYIKENPNLYAVMGGYKYEPSVLSKNYIPLTDEGNKIVQNAKEKDDYLHSLQYKSDKKELLNAQKKRLIGQTLTDGEI